VLMWISNSKFTSTQVQFKYPDVVLILPFYWRYIERWLVWTWDG